MLPKLVAHALVAASLAVLLSSTLRIGLAVSSGDGPAAVASAPSHDAPGSRDAGDDREPVLPMNRRRLAVDRGDRGPGGVADVLPRLLAPAARGRTVPAGGPPATCGALVYVRQVPGAAGARLDARVARLVAAAGPGASLLDSETQRSRIAFVHRATARLANLGPADWLVVRSGGGPNGLALAADDAAAVLRKWRDAVEGKGCRFVATAVFADVLEHAIERTKARFAAFEGDRREGFEETLRDALRDPAEWPGQLEGFLFGDDVSDGGSSGDDAATDRRGRVQRGMRLLRDHFDLVLRHGRAGADDLAAEVRRVTGWRDPGSPPEEEETSVADSEADGERELLFSKELVSQFGKTAAANGDADFLDAVDHVYHDSLGFLFAQ